MFVRVSCVAYRDKSSHHFFYERLIQCISLFILYIGKMWTFPGIPIEKMSIKHWKKWKRDMEKPFLFVNHFCCKILVRSAWTIRINVGNWNGNVFHTIRIATQEIGNMVIMLLLKCFLNVDKSVTYYLLDSSCRIQVLFYIK